MTMAYLAHYSIGFQYLLKDNCKNIESRSLANFVQINIVGVLVLENNHLKQFLLVQ